MEHNLTQMKFYHMCKMGNSHMVIQQLTHLGIDFSYPFFEGQTLLHSICDCASVEIFRAIRPYVKDLEVKDKFGRTIIYNAIKREQLDLFTVLLKNGVSLQVQDVHGKSPLEYATDLGCKSIIKLLLTITELYFEKNYLSLMKASIKANVFEPFEYLLKKGVDVNMSDEDGQTLLLYCCQFGDQKTIEHLLNCKADTSAVDQYNINAVLTLANRALQHRMTVNSDTLKVKAKQSDIKSHVHERMTQFNDEFEETMKRLIKSDMDLNMVDTNGWSALHYTCFLGNIALSQHLMESNCNLNIQTRTEYKKIPKGSTPLHIAVTTNSLDVAKYLLLKHADATIADQDGNTALHFALDNEMTEIIESLLHQGCHKAMRNKYGQTPLYYHVANNCFTSNEEFLAVLKLFIVANDQDNSGMTLLQREADKGDIGIIDIFLSNTTIHSWDYINYAKKPIVPMEEDMLTDLMWYVKTTNEEIVRFRDQKRTDWICPEIRLVHPEIPGRIIQLRGLTALQIAMLKVKEHWHTVDIVRKILQCGGDVHVKYTTGSNQYTIMQQAYYCISTSKGHNYPEVATENIYWLFSLLSAGAKYDEGDDYFGNLRNMERNMMIGDDTFIENIKILGYKLRVDAVVDEDIYYNKTCCCLKSYAITKILMSTNLLSLEVLAARVLRVNLYPNAWVAAEKLLLPQKLYIKHFEIYMNTPKPSWRGTGV